MPGYAGIPPGPLSAYLGVERESREQEGAQIGRLAQMLKIKALAEQQQEQQAYRSELATAKTPEQQLAIASKRMGPEALGKIIQSSEDRKEAAKQRAQQFIMSLDARQQDLDRKREEFMQRTQDNAARQAFEQWYKTESLKRQQAQDATTNELRKMGIEIQRQGLELRRETAGAKQEQRGATGDYAELLTNRLNTLLEENPRSATGIFAPVVRATEAVVNAFAPGAIGSQAIISSQTKEQLITVLSQLRGGAMGRLSNQDMRRVDTAIGQINSGTQEGMAQGLSDTYDLIDTLQGKPARSVRGITKPITRPVIPQPPPGFRLNP